MAPPRKTKQPDRPLEQRTGPCEIPRCTKKCEGFVLAKVEHGWRVCRECGHTQDSHAFPAEVT